MERIPYKSKEQKDREKKRTNQKRYYAQRSSQEKNIAHKLKQMFRED